MSAPRPALAKPVAPKVVQAKAAKPKSPEPIPAQPEAAPAQRKVVEPRPEKAPRPQAKAASQTPKAAEPKPTKAAGKTPQPEQTKPAPVQRKAVEPKRAKATETVTQPAASAPKAKAAKPGPEVTRPAPLMERNEGPALEVPPAEAPKPPSPQVEPQPAAAVAAPVELASKALSASNPASTEAGPSGPPTVQRAPQPLGASTAALDAFGRRLASRLARTESALSPWTQQTLQLQRPAPPAEPKTSEAQGSPRDIGEPTRVPRSSESLGSLARRIQRQEQQGASGTFGRLAGGVERTERFAGRIAAHFPELAAKYETPAAPEGGAAAPAPSGPNFTYYPEGASTSSKSSQTTMTATEMLKQLGLPSGGAPSGSTPPSGVPLQRTSAPETPAPKPAAPPPQPQAPRDPRRVRRFSKIEEVPPPGEERRAPPVAQTPPPAPAVQHRPEPARPQVAPRVATSARPEANSPAHPQARPGDKEQTPPAPPRRRKRFEEVSTPSSAVPVQRSPEPETAPAPPTPATGDDAGPLRWDHLGDLPPSVQRQLERVQQRLAEQTGLQAPPAERLPPADPNAERPFHPRNINPPPPQLAESLPSRLPSPESEAPISFGPDLQPRATTAQPQAQPPAAPAEPAAASKPAVTPASSLPRTEFELPEPEPLDLPDEPIAPVAPITQSESPLGLQRAADHPTALETPLSNQALPFVTPPASDPSETAPGTAPELDVAFGLPADKPAIQRSPEPATPVEPPTLDQTLQQPAPVEREMPVVPGETDTARAEPQRPAEPLTLRQPPAPPQQAPAPSVQRQPTEPRTTSRATRAAPAAAEASQPPATPQQHESTASAAVDRAGSQPEPHPVQPAKKASESPAADLQRSVAEAAAPASSPVASPAQPPLTLRQPTAPEPTAGDEPPDKSPNRATAESAAQLPPLPSATEAAAPVIQHGPLVEKPAAEPLVLREPAQPPVALPERPVVQRAQPSAPPAPIQLPVSESKPESSEAASPAIVADIQRAPVEPPQQPLILRETALEPPAENLSASVQPRVVAPVQSDTAPATPASQRQPTAAADLPLRAASVTRDDAAASVATTARAPDSSQTARLQRQSDQAVPPQALPLRAAPEVGPTSEQADLPLRAAPASGGETAAGVETTTSAPDIPQSPRIQRQAVPQPALPLLVPPEGIESPQAAETRGGQAAAKTRASAHGEQPRAPRPATSMPARPTPPAAIQHQAETPASRGPSLAMPLREPPADARPGPTPAGGASPQLLLGSQVYARGMKDARMAVMGPLATNVRHNIQRRPAPSAPVGTQTMPAAGASTILGLARSASLHTSVLPQTRVQREDEAPNQPQNQLVPVSQPSGTLPLAPPGPAPVNPNQSAPTTSTALVPSRPAQNLPLAPVIARDSGNNNTQLETTGGGDSSDDLDDLLSGLEDDADLDDEDDKEVDLDDLADKLLPYIKRLMAVERQRDDPI